MGTSNWQNIPWCVQAIMRVEPDRVLDVGVGYGRWGMILREFAEVWFGRVLPEEWKIEIEGIEAFERNVSDYHQHFYDRIHIGDALEVIPNLDGRWNLAVLGDVLEHFFKSDGEKLLAGLVERSDYVLINLPLGDEWPQEEMYENPYEEHKAVWEIEDFDPSLICAQRTFLDFQERPFASIVLSKTDPKNLRGGLFGSPEQGDVSPGRAKTTRDLDFGDEDLIESIRERIRALESIRASGAWRAIRQARDNPIVWQLGRTLRRNRGELFSIRNLDGRSLPILRIESDGSAILWDFFQRRGDWSLEADGRAAFGESLTSRGSGDTLRWFGYDGTIRIHFLGDVNAGRCRLSIGRKSFEIDLRRNRQTPLVFDAADEQLYERDAPVDLLANEPPSSESEPDFDRAEQDVLRRLRESPSPVLAVYPPGWTGIRNSTMALFDIHHPLPEKLDGSTRDRFLRLVEESRCESLVLSGGALDHLHLAREINERSPETKVRVLWHGSFLQVREDYAWRGLRLLTELANRNVIHAIGFVKEGMSEVFERLGLRAAFVLNYVDEIPVAPSKHAEGGPHLGMWVSNEGWRKPPYAMAAGVSRLPGANLHFNGDRKRLSEFARLVGLTIQPHGEGLFGREELGKWMRTMHLNLYVTLSECCPMLPLESLSVGTPCLIGPNSHLFRDDRYLFDRLVVPFPDSSDAIHSKCVQALEERDEIIDAYRAYAPGYNHRAKTSLKRFLDI